MRNACAIATLITSLVLGVFGCANERAPAPVSRETEHPQSMASDARAKSDPIAPAGQRVDASAPIEASSPAETPAPVGGATPREASAGPLDVGPHAPDAGGSGADGGGALSAPGGAQCDPSKHPDLFPALDPPGACGPGDRCAQAGTACAKSGSKPGACLPCEAGKPCVIYDIDLTTQGKGHPNVFAGGVGKFTEAGWSCTAWNDQLKWYLPGAIGIREGYVEVEVTNFDPVNQRMIGNAPKIFSGGNCSDSQRNEFLRVMDTCPGAPKGFEWQFRMGQGYSPPNYFKLETAASGKAYEIGMALMQPRWDLKATYGIRLEWNATSFGLAVRSGATITRQSPFVSAARADFDGHPAGQARRAMGACLITLGEAYPQKSYHNSAKPGGCLDGPIYKSIKVVSLSGPPEAAPAGDLSKLDPYHRSPAQMAACGYDFECRPAGILPRCRNMATDPMCR
jgi:hypothetical protein